MEIGEQRTIKDENTCYSSMAFHNVHV